MKATKNSVRRLTLIILYKMNSTYLFIKSALTERFKEVSACISENTRLYDNNALNGSLDYIHLFMPLF